MENFIVHKNTQVYYSSEGKGTTVVFLHGFLENASMWNSLVTALSTKYRVVTIDLLGHGKSECLGYVHTMEMMADAVQAVLQHLKLRRFFIVGHSMGGYVALALAKKSPEKVKGLCLMNSTASADSLERIQLRTRANKMAQQNFKTLVQLSFTNLFSETSRINYKKELDFALAEAFKTSLQGYIAAQEGMCIRPDAQEFLKNQDFQKLYIIGKKDTVLNVQELQKEAAHTQSEVVLLDQGHMSHIENKAEVIKALKAFLKKR
ncbi:alpha/beta hydrolase [Polaribacter pacificus]|uniref:Alpha/beta hydrolase n=1 Tax=Polaribacter pacificus TaxID=1775173 RepID=A0A917HW78_9FLAO|nr:alpha/beta hydrolase [Polaribacter pacificus]GGG92172.1 alpha/beta hydrolase [Polaribacter pacificus]